MKVGITGGNGFIGGHLLNYLRLNEKFEIVPFDRVFFEEVQQMDKFVQSCDCIIHLAGLNRHSDPEVMYNTNISLCNKLIDSLVRTKSSPHVIFSSSTQEEEDNVYGRSKKEGALLFQKWALDYDATVTCVIIPNVFGPFGQPYYNSVVATFCHQLTNNQIPEIHQDKTLNLIYINELIANFVQLILYPIAGKIKLSHQYTMNVTEILELLTSYKNDYLENGIFPNLTEPKELAFFNTFRCYIPHQHYPVNFRLNNDDRGLFVEIARTNTSGQFSFSTTKPGITRGNHFHTRKAERFAVIKGKAKISLRRIGTEKIIDYILDGDTPAYVDMPIWHTHNITNIGDEELVTLFWINEPYNSEDPDTEFIVV